MSMKTPPNLFILRSLCLVHFPLFNMRQIILTRTKLPRHIRHINITLFSLVIRCDILKISLGRGGILLTNDGIMARVIDFLDRSQQMEPQGYNLILLLQAIDSKFFPLRKFPPTKRIVSWTVIDIIIFIRYRIVGIRSRPQVEA